MSFTIDHGPALALETKAVSECDDAWVVTGFASVFGNKDLTGDIVMPGAFQKSLREHGMPLLMFNHKHDDVPLGCVVECEERKKGLWFRAEMPRSDQFVSGRIIPQLKRRGLKGVSIGYKAIEREQRKDARLLKQVRLYEISLVSSPANPLAEVEMVKSLSPEEEAELAVFGSVFGNFTEELHEIARRIKERGR